ncbi:hypothetical protein BJ138DRAFT_1114059 [Hygrophoropsis aurantiaca]|uniref:Uncharacterized protein n=1 Tax=Hygrophoropsis aurantiaca TaxID=72124 RepID=A0ACB8AAJ7_9AGAM|nr:hypothetical protein BJ138DRAFT_1114059 [Hygrophoropsis aurantiaca]
MGEDSDISNSLKVEIPIANSSIVPESPCIKIVNIVGKLSNGLFPNYDVVPTSDTLYFLFQPILAGESFIQIWDDSSDGNSLFLVQESGIRATIDLWDIHSSTFIRKLGGTERLDQNNLAFVLSPDDRKLAVSSYDRLHIYDVHTGTLLSSCRLLSGTAVIGWSQNGDWLLTNARDDSMTSFIMWLITDDGDVEPINVRHTLNCPWHDASRCIQFSGDTIICVNEITSYITIYHLENGHLQVRVQKHYEECGGHLRFSLDTRMFACTTEDGTCVIIRDAISANIIGGPLQISYGKKIVSLDFASNGKQLVGCLIDTSIGDTAIYIWDLEAAIEQYRVANLQAETNHPRLSKKKGRQVTAHQGIPAKRAESRSNSIGSSILNLPMSDVATPSASPSPPTQTPYTQRREARKPIDYDSLLDLPATDTPIRPRTHNAPSDAPRSPPAPQGSGNQLEAAAVVPSAPGHSQRRARLTALWARIRRRRKPGPTLEQGSRARKNKSKSESNPMRDLSDAPVLPSAPAPTDDPGIVEVAAGRLDDRLVIAPPRKKKKKKLPVSPPLQAAENAEVQPASQSNASSAASSASSSSQTDSDAESIDWLDYICFCMCLPSNKTKKKKRKEKEKAGR